MELFARTSDEMREIGRKLASCLRDGDVVSLNGSLGAGKTQLAQGVGEGLGIERKLVSPTFNIVFEYLDGDVGLYHFDLYRLEDASQLEDIDFYELSDPSTPGASLIEWANLFPDELPEDRLEVEIDVTEGECRALSAHAMGPRSQELLSQWEGASPEFARRSK